MPGGSLPTLTAQVAFGSLPTDASQTWTTLDDNALQEFSLKRGRADEKTETETGVMTWVLRNNDRKFDPEYASSPYYPNVQPVKMVRLRATFNAITYDLFTGDSEDWPQGWEGRENTVSLSALDGFDALNMAEVSIDRSVELSGARITAILDAAGWPSALRSIDTGQSLLAAMTDATDGAYANALSLLREVAVSENGNIFMDGQGRVVFHNRHKRMQSPYTTSQVTLNNIPAGAELGYADARPRRRKADIVNFAAVSMPDGTTFTSEDTTSKNAYRRRTRSVTVVLSNPVEGQSFAQYIVGAYKDPITAWDYVTFEPQLDDALWPHALGREIGDRVTVKATPPGGGSVINKEAIIESIAHKMVRGRWTTTWRLGRADIATGNWILGTSLLDTGTKLAY